MIADTCHSRPADFRKVKRADRARHAHSYASIGVYKDRRKSYREKRRFFCGVVIIIHKINCIFFYVPEELLA